MRHFFIFFLILPFIGQAQLNEYFQLDSDQLKNSISKFKKDPRGPLII